jgi:hypothetical protein
VEEHETARDVIRFLAGNGGKHTFAWRDRHYYFSCKSFSSKDTKGTKNTKGKNEKKKEGKEPFPMIFTAKYPAG